MPVMRAALWLSVFLLAFQPAFLSALTQPEVLQILGEQVLRPSLDIEEVRVLLVPAPLMPRGHANWRATRTEYAG